MKSATIPSLRSLGRSGASPAEPLGKRPPANLNSRHRFWEGVIRGEPASKANSRRMALRISNTGKRFPAPIRSAKAIGYADAVAMQTPVLSPLLEGPLSITATIYYASERPDLDESILLDAMQNRIYRNDRQIKEKHITHAIDRSNPRAEVMVEELGE